VSKFGRVITHALILTSLCGCAATGELFKPGEGVPGMSSLYIYRENSWTGALLAWDIKLDGEKVAELRRGGYMYTAIPPGSHTVSVLVSRGLSLRLATEPNNSYYVAVRSESVFLGVVTIHRFRIEPVPESFALYELHDMRLQQALKAE
jgi:hypothetical protein